jgi:DNA-binding MarR family transcriptional regulator
MKAAGDQTAVILLDILPRLMRFVHHGLRGHPLTLQQLRVLGALIEGEHSPSEVASELGIRPPTVTGLVGSLEHQGLISRRRDPMAWRVILLDLTPAGRDVYHTIMLAARRRLGGLLADMSSIDQASLRHTLAALGEALERTELRTGLDTSTGGGAAIDTFEESALT